MKCEFGKGTYFIGDICYALKESYYDMIWGEEYGYENGVFKIGKDKFVVANTAFGDGCFKGTDDREYGVDAGVIGVVPKKLWGPKEELSLGGGRVVRVKNKLVFKTDERGLFEINIDGKDIQIDTR